MKEKWSERDSNPRPLHCEQLYLVMNRLIYRGLLASGDTFLYLGLPKRYHAGYHR